MTPSAHRITVDGNEAAALVAHRLSEVIAIYPITPSSNMGELADAWSSEGRQNVWGSVPKVIEMQSEGGAAGTLHGAATAGSLATTFTASQGLLLMIPNLYKLAGEQTPAVIHVAARSLATNHLSIFGDHQDVMACRQTGCLMLASESVQEAHDLAAIAHAWSLSARLPVLHFFEGFRVSHELNRLDQLSDDDLVALIDASAVDQQHAYGLEPERPVIRGTAMNPDTSMQAREAVEPAYHRAPALFDDLCFRFLQLSGRRYQAVRYEGHTNASRVVVVMGSGAVACRAAVQELRERGENVGVLQITLYRPFPAKAVVEALPDSVTDIAVLDRTKEPGSVGEPLYSDVVAALAQHRRTNMPRVVGGRYGLSSKEFTPALAAAALRALRLPQPPHGFTLGIDDDITGSSLSPLVGFDHEIVGVTGAILYGLGSDGTVGAAKAAMKIAADAGKEVQGYFVYDSKKSGSLTASHLRFGTDPIQAPWLVQEAHFIGIHHPRFLTSTDCLAAVAPGATVLLNLPGDGATVWDTLPGAMQETIIAEKLQVFAVDATAVAEAAGLGRRINTVMLTCFLHLAHIVPGDSAAKELKKAASKAYAKAGEKVVSANHRAIDAAIQGLISIRPGDLSQAADAASVVAADTPDAVRRLIEPQITGTGDTLPVSALPSDGSFATATSRYEKRGLTEKIPVWQAEGCVGCGNCSTVCPHAAIRQVVVPAASSVPEEAATIPAKIKGRDDLAQTIVVSGADCTGCGICLSACPTVDKEGKVPGLVWGTMTEHGAASDAAWEWALGEQVEIIPEQQPTTVRAVATKPTRFEFPGSCTGCGETPYLKVLSQLVGDRLLIANATGCSSIFGGNLPTTPWSTDKQGCGPAWSNSLFEDNAEFGLGMRLACDQQQAQAHAALQACSDRVDLSLAERAVTPGKNDAERNAQRQAVRSLKKQLSDDPTASSQRLLALADRLLDKSVWMIGGDGWAYDIGFGGLDHVLASGEKVRVLVLDSEVYSNTGGQASKATPRAAVARFATGGRDMAKKDLALAAMSYGTIYVARVCLGANPNQAIKAINEAEAFDGPALIIGYAPCIAHGIDLGDSLERQQLALQSGHWPLLRWNPDGKKKLSIDSKKPSRPYADFANGEARFQQLLRRDPDAGEAMLAAAQRDVDERWQRYENLAATANATCPA